MSQRTRPMLLILLIALQAISLAGILITARAKTEEVMLEHAQLVLAHVGETVADKTRLFLAPAERTASLTRHLLETGTLEGARLEPYLIEQLRSNPQLTGAYLGQPDGAFVFVSRDGTGFRTKRIWVQTKRQVKLVFRDAHLHLTRQMSDPTDHYDPRQRPWYRLASQSNNTIWTNPYVFFTSKQPGLTAATAVRDRNGRIAGVVGVDIEISGLSAYLGHVPISANGRAFIVDAAGRLIVAPGLTAFASGELPRLSQAGSPQARALLAQFSNRDLTTFTAREFVRFEQDRQTMIGGLEPFSIGNGTRWLLGVHAPVADFIGSLEPIAAQYRLDIILVFAVTCALAVPIVFGAWNPLSQLERRATVDGLTGLPNRSEFLHRAEVMLKQARKRDQTIAVAMLDLDGFKGINDTQGHAVGDQVLGVIGERLRASVRRGDLAGRVGGDEFALILSCTNALEAERQLERIRAAVFDQPVHVADRLHQLGATVGLTIADADLDVKKLFDYLAQADLALLGGKRNGKNRVVQA